MGLIKRDGYIIKGVDLTPAYAKIMRIYLGSCGNASAVFGISTTRDNLNQGEVLAEINFDCTVDKDAKIYEEIYDQAKVDIFPNWEDDIPEPTPTPDEDDDEELSI